MSFIMPPPQKKNKKISTIIPVFYVAIHTNRVSKKKYSYESDLSAEHESILNHLSFHTPSAWDRTLIFERFFPSRANGK